REIAVSQKFRDDSRRSLGAEHDPVRVKDVEEISAIEHERYYSNPPADAGLEKPPVPPALPPIPTAEWLAQQAREEKRDAEVARAKFTAEILKRTLGAQKAPAQKQLKEPSSSNQS